MIPGEQPTREELLARLAMLEKVNNALMDRVERSVDSAGDSYALFENNVIMQGLIAERTRALEQVNAALTAEIGIRRQAERALLAAKEQAEAASRSKSEFLANMSHEIRTPMTAILGYADLAAEEDADPDARAEHLRVIKRSGRHLLCIINDILDLSKLDAGQMKVAQEPVRPEEICRGVIELMRVQAESKGIALRFERDPLSPERVLSDPIRLRQIVLNLVGNAVKFTDAGAVTVRLGGDGTPGGVCVAVEDSGPGIRPDDLDRIFTPFHQGDGSASRRHGGTGLGLAIAQRFAGLLGGEIGVESVPGRGSVFTLRLRCEAAVPHAADARPSPAGTSRSNDPGTLAGRRVLLAEDGPDNRRLIVFFLERAGAEVDTACNGRAALDAALSGGVPYDLILMDMQMPEMDGYDATRALRRAGDRTPVIALTAHAMQGDRERCLAAGCDEYLTKPIDRRALVSACERFVGRAGGLRASA